MDSNDKKGLKSTEIIIINGSPRINKNCSFIANKVKAMLEECGLSCKIFNIYNMDIEYCTACGFCEKQGIASLMMI